MEKKDNNKKKWIIAVLVAVVVIIGILIVINPEILYNNSKFNKAMSSNKENEIVLNEIVPFKWDKLYTFAPYTNKEDIENTIGFKSSYIRESVNDDMMQIVFVRGNKVVCSICDSISELGYTLQFDKTIKYDDNVKMTVENEDGVKSLKIK